MPTVGRLSLNHPALGTAGGSALFTLINTIYQTIGDAVTGRYLTASAVANGATVTLTHGFGAAFAEYRYALYSASSGVLGSRLFTGWTVVANATNPLTAVDVTNNSGSTSDIILVLIHSGGNVNYTYMDFLQLAATPANPASGFNRIYPKADGNLYSLNASGLEQVIGAGGTGAKNYVPVASQSGTGAWVSAGMTQTTSTLATELPRANTTKQGLKLTPTPATFNFTAPGSGSTLTSTTPHGMQTGYVVNLTTTGTIPAPFVVSTPYYVNVLSTTTFQLAASMANLVAGSFITNTSAGSGTQSATYAVSYLRYTLDFADYGVPQQVSLAQNILSGINNDYELDVWANTSSAYTGTSTRINLKKDSGGVTYLPNYEGTYTTNFDAPTASNPYVEIRIVKVAANTHAIVLSDVSVGPGVSVQGASVGPEQSWTPTITGLGTTTGVVALYSIVGEYIIAKVKGVAGTVSATTLSVSLPNSWTTSDGVTAGVNFKVGDWLRASNSAANSAKNGIIIAANGSPQTTLNFASSDYSTAVAPTAIRLGNSDYSSGETFEWNFRVRIDQLIGSGTVNLASNSPEYASNSSSTDADDLTSFVYGPQGAAGVIKTTNLTTTRRKRVSFLSPIGPTDQFLIELYDPTANQWFPHHTNYHGSFGYVVQASQGYGMFLAPVSGAPNQLDVYFMQYAYPITGAFGSAGQAWNASFQLTAFRIKKFSSSQVTAFGPYLPPSAANPAGFSGLIPASGVPGRTDGNLIPAGGVGEYLESKSAAVALTVSSTATLLTLPVPAGTWDLTGQLTVNGVAAAALYGSIVSTAGTNGVFGDNYMLAAVSSTGNGALTISYRVTVSPASAPQNWYLTGGCSVAQSSGSAGMKLCARRA